MPETSIDPGSAEQAVRDGLAAADRRRRARDTSRRVWQAAPLLAAFVLIVAGLSRWAVWPRTVPVTVIAAAVAGVLIYVLSARRRQAISDAAASTIDAEAGMRGELRSANWFASRPSRDGWADLHLERAAERLRSYDWSERYPSVRAPKAQLATALMTIGALALTVTLPERVGIRPAASAATKETDAKADIREQGLILDPELQRQLEALLAAAASGNLPTTQALMSNAEMKALLEKLGLMSEAELLNALERALAANPDLQAKDTVQNLKALAEQAKRDTWSGEMSRELKEALEKLAGDMELVQAQESENGEAAAAGGPQQGEVAQGSDSNGGQELSIQFAKEAESGGAAGVLMMASSDAQQGAGPPGFGVGGSGGQDAAPGGPTLEAALKQETVEASQDNPGTNIETDIRRKTEQGNATVSFTHSATGTFDRGRAAAPPPVPEARRTGVQTYFIRKQ